MVKVVDLSELVSKDAELMRASVPKRVSLQLDLDQDLPCLEADPSQLEQILMNLVINAGEAIPPKTDGVIRVATRTCEVTPELANRHSDNGVVAGRFICLEVKDNGSGIDPSALARIFDPFFSTKFTGRGLGLAAVHGIVRAAKGFIEVSSHPGSGTQFKVFLPASDKPVHSVPLVQVRRSATILVVDDEEMVRKLACICLRRHGYEVSEATNGRETLNPFPASSVASRVHAGQRKQPSPSPHARRNPATAEPGGRLYLRRSGGVCLLCLSALLTCLGDR